MTSYVLWDGGRRIEITLTPLKRLRPHEQVLGEDVDRLVESLMAEGSLKHPIVADKTTGIVLDGSHRLAALARLHCDKALVCYVNYDSPTITLGSWFRCLRGPRQNEPIEKVANEFHLKPLDPNHSLSRPASVLKSWKTDYLVAEAADKHEVYEKIYALERELRERGIEVSYETEEYSLQLLHARRLMGVITVPRLSKEEVKHTVARGRVFSPKATRHVIPLRPLGANVPVDYLKPALKLDAAKIKLVEHLERMRVVKRKSHCRIGSRTYEEEVYTFEC